MMLFKKYIPKKGDIVLLKHADMLCEVISENVKYRDINVRIMRCHYKEREGELHLANPNDLKLIWRR